MKHNDKNIIFYDAECGFCSFWVRWLLKRDKKHTFYFASLHSDLAKEYNFHQLNKDTLVLIYRNTIFTKSRAVAAILSELSLPYRVLSTVILMFPICWADSVYSFVAANRFLGGKNSCQLKEMEKFKPYILS
tara:strand:- start:9398 stop:9793 length:396 start_codon:yes stop_codon:yes gene_type:complete